MAQFNKNGTFLLRVTCAIFFLLFTYFYLYDYQCNILAVAQHVLSHGATHYNRTVGAIVITLVLWLIQLVLYALTGLGRRGHALTYVPSLLLLGVLTDVSPNVSDSYLGNWLWAFPLLMVLYGFVVWVVRQLEPMEPATNATGLFSRMMWINMLQMVVFALVTCGIGCNDTVFHYRMNVESDIIDGDYAKALSVGCYDAKTDSSLTMLRVWAVSESGKLGDHLFEYPLKGRSDAMLPNGRSVQMLMATEVKLYEKLGVYFKQKMRPRQYLEKLHQKGYATPQAHDWLLCAYLLDCDLDAFVNALPHYYNVQKALPLHYREALVLYNHLRQHPHIVYHSQVMDADFEDFIQLLHSTGDVNTRSFLLHTNFDKTYWNYYYSNSGRK